MSEFVELVTGRGDPSQPHVGPEDDAALRRGIMGKGNYVFQQDALDATMKDSNTIVIPPMELLLHGRHVRVKQAVEVSVESGTQAQKRIDIACIQLTRNDDGMETGDLITIKGEPTTDNPTPPEIPDTDFDSTAQQTVPLYQIPLDGITVGDPKPVFEQIGPLRSLWDSVSQIVLFNDPNAKAGNKVTLSQPVSEFDHIIIEYQHGIAGNMNQTENITVFHPDGKHVSLTGVAASSTQVWIKSRLVTISGTTITSIKKQSGTGNTGTTSFNSEDPMAITRVLGFRTV